jgi:hypothetical protein
METKRYFLLKKRDGWHVCQEVKHVPVIEYSEVLGPTDEDTARGVLKDLRKDARPEQV